MKGIIFNPDMIGAIVEGRKTQTRRLIKPQPKQINNDFDGTWEWKEMGHYYDDLTLFTMLKNSSRYHAGETVYIKEAYALRPHSDGGYWEAQYKSNGEIRDCNCAVDAIREIAYKWDDKWRSPLFMPEWAARYFLKILAVRAERLQEITYGDCIAEGIEEILEYPDDVTNKALRRIGAEEVTEPYHMGWRNYQYRHDKRYKWYNPNLEPEWFAGRPDLSFKSLWDSINPKYLWVSNPWVFPYDFEYKGGK